MQNLVNAGAMRPRLVMIGNLSINETNQHSVPKSTRITPCMTLFIAGLYGIQFAG